LININNIQDSSFNEGDNSSFDNENRNNTFIYMPTVSWSEKVYNTIYKNCAKVQLNLTVNVEKIFKDLSQDNNCNHNNDTPSIIQTFLFHIDGNFDPERTMLLILQKYIEEYLFTFLMDRIDYGAVCAYGEKYKHNVNNDKVILVFCKSESE
jgi:hypothetical protein